MNIGSIERLLKRYLKRRVGCTLSLLVIFLISGRITLGDTLGTIQLEKKELLEKIKIEKERIKEQLDKNLKEIKQIDENQYELVKKADWYSKPVFESSQIEVFFSKTNSGKLKDRTEKEFKRTLDAVKNETGRKLNGTDLVNNSGMIIDDKKNLITYDVGANIKPVVPILPQIRPNPELDVLIPIINVDPLPKAPTISIPHIMSPTNPTLSSVIQPNGVKVNITTPGAVDKIELTAPIITEPVVPSDKLVVVNTPATPSSYDPIQVLPPTLPEIPEMEAVSVPQVIALNLNSASSGNSDKAWAWDPNGSNGLISQVIITSGKFLFVTGGSGTANSFDAEVTGYTATAAAGYDINVNNVTYGRTTVPANKAGMVRVIGSRYSSFGENTEVIIDATARPDSGTYLRQFIHFDPHGNKSAATIDEITEASVEERTQATDLTNKYKVAHSNFEDKGYQILSLNGQIIVNGNTTVGVGLQGHSEGGRNPMILHKGTYVLTGNKNAVFAYPNDGDNTNRLYIVSNYDTGKIEVNGNDNVVMLAEKSYASHVHNFENSGVIEIKTGNKNIGFSGVRGMNNGYVDLQNPILISSNGTENIGVYQANEIRNNLNEDSVIKVDISNGQRNVGYLGEFTSQTINTNIYNITGGKNNIGVISSNNLILNGLILNISGGEKNYGIINKVGTLSSNGTITISGGNDNIGLVNQSVGDAVHTGDIVLSATGVNNIAIYGDSTATTTVAGEIRVNGDKNKAIYGTNSHVVNVQNITANTTDSIIIYGESGAKITVENELNVVSNIGANPTTVNKKDTGAVFATGANTMIALNRASVSNTANISITGAQLDDADKYAGFGIIAVDGSTVEARNNYIKIKDGSVGVASIGVGTSIDLSGGILEFDGNGYAVYSDGNGKVDLSGTKLILKGNSVAFDIDLGAGASTPIILDSNSRIQVASNDVVVFNLKNVDGISTNGLETSITGSLGGALGGTSLANLIVADDGIDKYKIAAVDGGTIVIGNLDKTGIGEVGETQSQVDGNFYYNRFLGQRLVATTEAGSTISAILDSEQAEKFNGQVVALEMNSSKLATSNKEAAINIVDSTIKADRKDLGAGAIGVFINYGLVTVDSTSNILVEKEDNVVNSGAVGIYSVNGSEVTNNGNLEVGGMGSIGILGMSYRESKNGTPLVNEFGLNAVNQGKIVIFNSKNISLDGDGSIGIYAKNNNNMATSADATVTNSATGVITVGNTGNTGAAVGIYGEKVTISNLGTISVGNGGVGIYGTENSNITDLGILNLGSDSIGVFVDGTTDITAKTITLTSNNDADLIGKTGVFYKGTGSENKTINLDVDASEFYKGIALMTEGMNISSGGDISVGRSGIGVYAKGTSANIVENTGTIDLTVGKSNAIGMYTKSTNLHNKGVINVNDASQIGIVAETSGNVKNMGTINLTVDGATGIFVKDGATVELASGSNIIFGGESNIGVFANNATIEFTDNVTLMESNENKNILVYGKEAIVNIALGKTVSIDGVGVATTSGNKTIGVYLEGVTTPSVFNGFGVLDVTNEAIGVYSKGNNIINANIVATGEKTTGIFSDGASKITGTVTTNGNAADGAIGVYGTGGIIDATDGLKLSTTTGKGTGIYLVDGASVSGTLDISNTSSEKNIGVYYSKGEATADVINNANININESNTVALYAADGITLVNNGDIVSIAGKEKNIGSFVGNGATLISNGNITLNDNDSMGLYVQDGKGVNKGSITMNGVATPGNSVIALIAGANVDEKAIIENTGTVQAGSNLGMYIAGNGSNSGINSGIIETTGVIGRGTGVYVEGKTNSFNGSGGTIKSDGVGIYLKDTAEGKITAGDLELGNGAVGVFADNGMIDFNVDTTTSTGSGVVGVTAKNSSVISGNIKTGQDSIGVYLIDDTVVFNGATIETDISNGATSIGVLLDGALTNYTLNNVSINAKDGVGLYLNTPTSGTRNIIYSATITTENGIGIFVDNGNILTNGEGIINVNGGAGIYVAAGGTANLGTTDSLTFNFLAGGGIGVFNDGGSLILGDNIIVTGSGSLAVTKNGDLTSSGSLNIGEGAIGLLGEYDIATNSTQKLSNTGIITAHSGGKGLVAVKGMSTPTGLVTVENTGIINIAGESSVEEASIGIYTDVAKIDNSLGIINVGNKGIGIFANDTGKDVNAGNIVLTGTDGIGVYLKGETGVFVGNNITGTGTGIIYEGTAPTLSIGTITLGNGSKGIIISGTGMVASVPTVLTGTISVGDSTLDKTAVGVAVQKGANVTFASATTITSGADGIGVYTEDSAVSDVNLNNITVGENGIYLYSKNSNITLATGNSVVNGKIGIYAKGGSVSISTLTVLNGGLGLYLEGDVGVSIGNIVVQDGVGNGKQSIGLYYKDMNGIVAINTVDQYGDYTIGTVLENTNGTIGNMSLISASNSVGVALKDESTLVANNLTVSGDKNIGVHSLDGLVTINGNINVFASRYSTDKTLSSIGVFGKKGTIIVNGDVSVGDNSIGVYGEAVDNISILGNISVGENALGVYASGNSTMSTLNVTGIHQIADNNTIGIFGENIDTTVSGNFIIGNNGSIGVVSKGNGDVNATGNMVIGESSIGIYKVDGSGDITVGGGTLVVDKKGYGIYATETSGTIINNADINLGESSIGIYSKGLNTVVNNGTITVGKTNFGPNNNPAETGNHLNSVGIFMSEGTVVKNTGIINVTEALSVGVYGNGVGNSFENIGVMNIDNGGVGVLVKNGAIAVNSGTINVGGTMNSAAPSIGMAAYMGSTIINSTSGVINVTDGVGMLVGMGGVLDNRGTINIIDGTGIYGDGQIKNSGVIIVTGIGTEMSGGAVTSTGSVQIDKDGNVTINGNYVSIGGKLIVDGSLDINGSFVDITTGNPVFEADSITGDVNILPNFALTGNGYSYEIEGFLNSLDSTAGSQVTPILSPMWVADIDRDGNLIIVKKPYADLTIGDQFDNLNKGLDNILMGDGNSSDKEILKNMNYYLSSLSDEDYANEVGRVLGETRGDIYSTIQMRMNTIESIFDSSFNNLEKLYNQTKSSDKYGIIYSTGDFKDSTVGIDNYKYDTVGLMYVHETEQVEYKSKLGYSLGFVVSKFDFDDDGKSKEDVYSLRVGFHKTKLLENKIELGTQLNTTYNYHNASRKMDLGYDIVENKGKYHTYSLELNNRFTKELYGDYDRNVKIYTGLRLGYGVLNSFKEKGNLILEVKNNDYYSIKPEIGTSSEYKYFVGKGSEVALFGDIALRYELGEVYDGNKARLKDGGEGYYSLITPEKEKGSLVFRVGTKFEQFNKFDITLENEGTIAENKDNIEMKYSIKFNYIF